MRNMSFSMTTEQVRARTKTVTRRLGWSNLKAGDLVCAVVKGMGLKKGEKVEPLVVIEIVSIRAERLIAIDDQDVAREGYPNKGRVWFVDKFCKAMACGPSKVIRRIEFKYREDLNP